MGEKIIQTVELVQTNYTGLQTRQKYKATQEVYKDEHEDRTNRTRREQTTTQERLYTEQVKDNNNDWISTTEHNNNEDDGKNNISGDQTKRRHVLLHERLKHNIEKDQERIIKTGGLCVTVHKVLRSK